MNSIRIIGGEWRRRVLRFPDSEGLRPTPDRVRETLFNWLGQDLTGLSCLDLFAGSGALGFEAASRGAANVTLVDQSPQVVAALRQNAGLLNAQNRLQVVQADAVKFASSRRGDGTRFDVLFMDPPYKKGWVERISPWFGTLVAEDGAIYVEAEYPVTSCGEWKTVRSGRAGQVFYHLMRSCKSDGAE